MYISRHNRPDLFTEFRCMDCASSIWRYVPKRCSACHSKSHYVPIHIRFWKYVNKTDNCWLWTGAADRGYGIIGVDGKSCAAHRISYELAFGKIPNGMSVLHRCDNPPCVNPKHLFLGSQADNMRDKVLKNRQLRGSNSPRAKLSEENVRTIRNLYKPHSQQVGGRALARRFGVCQQVVSDIVNGKIWRNN